MDGRIGRHPPLTPEGFQERLLEVLAEEISIFPARSFWPSALDHPCDRQVVWRFTRWELQEPHSPIRQAIFDQGRHYQPLIYARLEAMGYDVVREGDRPRQYRVRGGGIVSGRPDGKLRGYRGVRFASPDVLECKSMSGFEYERTHAVEDLKKAKSVWTRLYHAQGQLYAFLEEVPGISFVLYSKATGMLKLIRDELDFGFVERLLERMERLQPMIAAGIDPPPISYDWNVCGGCGFLKQCYPPRDFGQGASIIDDPEFVELLERRELLRPHSREYETIDKAVKARLGHEGIEYAIAGPFTIEGTQIDREAYSVPKGSYVKYSIKRAGTPGSGLEH